MVGVYKCGRFKGSEDAKVQCWEVRWWEATSVGGLKGVRM